MCMITDIIKVDGKVVLCCTPYNGSFLEAKILKIYNKVNVVLETNAFIIDSTKPCFGKTRYEPIIMLTEGVPPAFLQRGNRIILEQ